MPYTAPGVYSKFVNTASAVSNPGASRILALVGTGVQTYTVYNEPVLRNPETTADMLQNPDVYQIVAVSSKPYYPNKTITNNIFFTAVGTAGTNGQVEYTLEQGSYVAWATPSGSNNVGTATVSPGSTPGSQAWTTAQTSVVVNGSAQLVNDITVLLDTADPNVMINGVPANDTFLLETGNFMVEITYVSAVGGAYRVVDMNTNAILGEYVASNTPVYEAIPGVALTVETTFVPNPNDPTGQTSLTNVGDYAIVTTTAATTNGLPSGTFTVNANGSLTLSTGVTYSQPKSPDNGQVYYVSYKYRKPAANFLPTIYFNYNSINGNYGTSSVTPGGRVINSLTLGAELAILNGASAIVCVQAASDNDADLMAAIDLLQQSYPGINTVNAIVPLTTFTSSYAVAAHLSGHVTEMSTELYHKERMGYVAQISTTDSVSQIAQNVSTFNNDRLVFTVPASVTRSIRNINTNQYATATLPGSFAAAALAGLAMGQDPAEPLTGKQLNGFISLGALYSDNEMNLMASNGACVLTQDGSVIQVRHGITTDTSGVNASEITVIQIRDYVIQAVRQALGKTYVGHKLLPTLVSSIKSTLQSVLNQMVAQNIILSYNIASVATSVNNPTQVNVSFQIEAVYPLNYIMIEFGLS